MYTVSNKNVDIAAAAVPDRRVAPVVVVAPVPVPVPVVAPAFPTFAPRLYRNQVRTNPDPTTNFEIEGGNCRGTRHAFWQIVDPRNG